MTPPFTSFSFYRSSEAGSYDHPTFSLQTTASPHVLISHLSTHTFGRGVCVPRQRVCAAPLAGVEARGERAKAIEGEQQPHVPSRPGRHTPIQYSGPAGARGAVAEKHVHAQWSFMNLVRRALASRGTCY